MHASINLLSAVALAGTLTAGSPLPPAGPSAATTNTSRLIQQLLPAGTHLGSVDRFTFQGRPYAVLTTMGIDRQPRPWIIVGRRNTSGQWTALYAHQTRPAFRATATLVGPTQGSQMAVTVTFLIDAATALQSNIDTLIVSPDQIRLATVLPNLVAAYPVTRTTHGIAVHALNFQAQEGFSHGVWQTQFTPLRQLLSASTHPVPFVLGMVSSTKGQPIPRIFILGPTTLHLTVGQTLSILPINAQAHQSLIGAHHNRDGMQGIAVYGGSSPTSLTLDGAAQILSTIEHFSQPGRYAIAIAPPGYRSLKPNAQVGIIRINVTP